jgi:hypothetical protein
VKVKLAIVADDVQMGVGNKPDIRGVFTEVAPQALPGYLEDKHLILFCEADATEFDEQRLFEVYLLAADGERIARWHDCYTVPKPPRPSGRSFFVLDWLLQAVPFAKAGDYAFSVVVGGDQKTSLPIYVHEPR